MSVHINVASGLRVKYNIQLLITLSVCITNLQTFLQTFTIEVWPRFDNPYIDVTIQEIVKFNDLLKCFVCSKTDFQEIFKLKHKKPIIDLKTNILEADSNKLTNCILNLLQKNSQLISELTFEMKKIN